MDHNFYLLFLDEIYTPNLNDFLKFNKEEIFKRANHLHFGISGVIIAALALEYINFRSRRIKNRFYPKIKHLIFHYVDIINERDNFTDLHLNSKKKLSFTNSLESFINNCDFSYCCSFIDKHELVKKYGIYDKNGKIVKIRKIGSNLFPKSSIVDYNLYLLSLKKILSSFYEFITSKKNGTRGIVVAEARGLREDTELREAFHKIQCSGIGSIGPKKLRTTILDLFIVPKYQNYIGNQIADLILYPTYDALVPNHNIREDHFISCEKILTKKLLKDGINLIP